MEVAWGRDPKATVGRPPNGSRKDREDEPTNEMVDYMTALRNPRDSTSSSEYGSERRDNRLILFRVGQEPVLKSQYHSRIR